VTKNKIGRQDGRREKYVDMGRKMKKNGRREARRKRMERQDVSKKKMGR